MTPAKHAAEANRVAQDIRAKSRAAGEPDPVPDRRATIARLQHLAQHSTDARQRSGANQQLPAARERLAVALGTDVDNLLVYQVPSPHPGAPPRRRAGRPPGTGKNQIAAREAARAAEATSDPSPAPAPKPQSFGEMIATKLQARLASIQGPATHPDFGDAPAAPPPAAHVALETDVDSRNAEGRSSLAVAPPVTIATRPAKAEKHVAGQALALLKEMERQKRAGASTSTGADAALRQALADRAAEIAEKDEIIAELRRALAKTRQGVESMSLVDLLIRLDVILNAVTIRTAPSALQAGGMSRNDATGHSMFQFRCHLGGARTYMRQLPTLGAKVPTIEAAEPAQGASSTAGWDWTSSMATPEVCPGVGSWRARG
ncbi:hypothetical protein GCM10011611_26360 [Aliidongia dinghuensis]|uniref:Uncharacterized protein n=1 Tax=Aliidongia dinghuensis TaxID=1867774 RepID=A0A8J3E3J4_9PROT|nr:hypothetical protein [Aliidongia dinghuensis]GGF19194.1 hypothetical protein GCM10011611_26360 [Aliidongia dinghuensis]